MSEKMKSVIRKITLNGATFDNEVIEPTYVNFFYGRNGVGKSTVARTIEGDDGVVWQDGRSASDYDVLVYSQDFINRNFETYGDLKGVFTVSEPNIKIQKQVEEKTAKKDELDRQAGEYTEQSGQKVTAQQNAEDTFQKACWDKTRDICGKFPDAVKGTGRKNLFAGAVLAVKAPAEQDLDKLAELYRIAYDSQARTYSQFSRISAAPTYGRLPGNDLMDKVVVSSSKTPFANFIKALNASDWVRQGHQHYSKEAAGKCPYCQQKLPANFLNVLKHGIEISNMKLELMYTKPATDFNKDLLAKYEQNIFSVMEEVWASDDERIDLVIFLNGLAIMSFELKCNAAGQAAEDAIYQYRTQRNPNTRLFLFKAGVLVNFAMDLNEVYMTTKLTGEDTFFLPFNMGNGEGVNAGRGNPVFEDRYSVSYMWEDILKKDTVLDLISKFIFIETKEETDELTGKTKRKESIIFPRYHQLDVIRKVLADVRENRTAQNYLIQHSAGSGKTNSIAWLAHRLSSLHDADNKIIFDNIVIVTDRVVVDRQLQAAVMGLEHKASLIRVMDDKCNSADLATALKGNTKIIATTIQKFPYIVDSVANLKKKHFAVIIDEAHSSTAGKDMAAVTKSLGSDYSISEDIVEDVEDVITKEIGKNGKQPNVSMFAFTATPKLTTLQLFGRVNTKGQREAFHIYSMKQAIEEGFILDVLSNYTTYDTFYRINKEIEEDPRCKTVDAKRQIARFVELHDTNISQRIEVIVEHFRQSVMTELGGMAKAMVVTASRQGAVKYRQALESYITKKGYTDIHALVAFSGKVKLPDDEQEYSEPSMNGFPEDRLTKEFDKDEYNVLLVANKYQTGFDQPKLCAMYVLKKLKGVSAVQTLSRLNRICPPFEKHTFLLDFVNTYDDIKAAFAPYYTTTLLSNSVTPTAIYDLEAKLDAYAVLDPDDIDKANELLYKPKITGKDKQKLTFYFNKTKNLIEKYELVKQAEIVAMMRHFVRFYEFLLQASCFEDVDLHKKYNFVLYVLAYINIKHPGGGYDLDGKIKATNFVQKKAEEHVKSDLVAQPVMKLPTAESFNLTEAKEERLSQIIAEINSRTGKSYDNDVAVKAMLQIRDIMLKSEKLKTSAKNNSEKDFEFSYFDNIDDALIEGLDQNQDFFSLLLGNDEIKREVLGIFAEEIYNSLRKA